MFIASPRSFSALIFQRLNRFFSAAILLTCLLAAISAAGAAEDGKTLPLVTWESGRLTYGTDGQGNRIPDFSHCGYCGANHPIPNVPARVTLSAIKDDNTERIQLALDYVASLPTNATGFRGAVLLRQGLYTVLGSLKIGTSGVVLRGEGMGADGTILEAAGTDRRTLLRIAGTNDRRLQTDVRHITDPYVPVGAMQFHLDGAESLNVGSNVCIIRPCTEAWIKSLGMDEFGGGLKGQFAWKPGSRDLAWDRVIRAIDANSVTIDAPITTAIDAVYGGATLQVYEWAGRVRNVGIENIRVRSAYNAENLKDEDHAWMAVTLECAEDAWVRQLAVQHFAGSAVTILETCRRITVEDCLSLSPVSEHGGYRRHTFFTMGQQTLFLRCWSEHGRHDFSSGHCAAGPNAFVQCESFQSLEDSGPIESWSSGVLYDNVRIDGNALRLCHRGSRGEGIGWAAANSVLWQCSAAVIECDSPPTAANWAFGCWGEFEGRAFWQSSNSFVEPRSLYAAQLQDRLGSTAKPVHLLTNNSSSTTSPSLELAAELTDASATPAVTLRDFILQSRQRTIPADLADVPALDDIPVTKSQTSSTALHQPEDMKLALSNGRLLCGKRLLTGGSQGVTWWRGSIRPDIASSFGPAITRFAPGRTGPGYTDDLNALTDAMAAGGQAVMEHNYGLWYDRRRDDHQHIRRMNGDVRPPFYEQPFARSGSGTAWDGLSRYDLTRFNPWYWGRLKEFADLCDRKGLVLIHQNYFQHNIIEAAAHWADFPWRPANNINDTGFPEPPYYAGDKRVFMDRPFYDTTHTVRAALHRSYIRKCLDNFSDNSNVIQSVGAEYTGPVEFVRFWLDAIMEWKQQTGQSPLICLSCTKDIQDEILSDPKRSKAVNAIDIRQWWYQGDGTLYAPEGGKHLAPRQHARLLHPRAPSFEQVVRAVRQYRQQYPDKAVLFSANDRFGWAVLMGGGSIPNVPPATDRNLLAAAAFMEPYDLPGQPDGQYALARPGHNYLIYADSGDVVEIDIAGEHDDLKMYRIDLETGTAVFSEQHVTGGNKKQIKLPATPCLLWLTLNEN